MHQARKSPVVWPATRSGCCRLLSSSVRSSIMVAQRVCSLPACHCTCLGTGLSNRIGGVTGRFRGGEANQPAQAVLRARLLVDGALQDDRVWAVRSRPPGHAHQVAGGRHQAAGRVRVRHAPAAGALPASRRLHPAEDLLHPLADAQAHRMAGRARRAIVKGRVLLLLPCDMRGCPSRPDVPHAVLTVRP